MQNRKRVFAILKAKDNIDKRTDFYSFSVNTLYFLNKSRLTVLLVMSLENIPFSTLHCIDSKRASKIMSIYVCENF